MITFRQNRAEIWYSQFWLSIARFYSFVAMKPPSLAGGGDATPWNIHRHSSCSKDNAVGMFAIQLWCRKVASMTGSGFGRASLGL